MIERKQNLSARHDDVVVEELGGELLIYDRRTDVAHCLSEVAAVAWRAFEDGATVDHAAGQILARGLASSLDEARTLADAAVAELDERDLLEHHEIRGFIGDRVPRRQALRRMAGVGMAAAAGPLVLSVAVPNAYASASSPTVCTVGNIYVEWTTSGGSTYYAMISASAGSSGSPNFTINSCTEITSSQLPPPHGGIQSADYGVTTTDSNMCGDLRMDVVDNGGVYTYYIGTTSGWNNSGNTGPSFIACQNPQRTGASCVYGSAQSQDPPGEHTSAFGSQVAGEVLVFTCPTSFPTGNCVMNTYACSSDDQCCSSKCKSGVCS